jgi:taurine dioxygenase
MSPIPTLRPLGETLGTEALGINLATALDAPTIAWIQQSFAEHPVLVFRDQDLGANELAAFGRIFGVPRKHSLVKYRHSDNEDVSWITNVDADGKIDWFGVKRATDWHTDSTFEDELPLLAILHAKEVPSAKGGTVFADMRAAYARLPEPRQRQLAADGVARQTERSRRRPALCWRQGDHRQAIRGKTVAGGHAPSSDRDAHSVCEPRCTRMVSRA